MRNSFLCYSEGLITVRVAVPPVRADYSSVVCAAQGRGSNIIHCRKDGTWSGSFHICQEMQGQCSAPDQLNGNLKLQCPEGYAIGTVGA